MWELIQANRTKSVILFIAMGVCLILLGYLIAEALSPKSGLVGVLIAFSLWLILCLISYFGGDSVLLTVSNAHPVSHDIHPQLFNIVEEMKIAASLPAMPKIYIIDDPAPNAFATGTKPRKSAIAVTAGLLSKLNRDELQGVIAHETSHIMNQDVLFATFAGIMLGAIVLMSEIFLRRMFWFGPSRKTRSRISSKGVGGQARLIILVVAIVFAILAPLLARLLYFAISRRREYLADASAVRLTRYPEGLAAALEKIAISPLDLKVANRVTAPMFIINPVKKKGMPLSDFTSTHPPITERIRILRSMTHGANLVDYQRAFLKATDKTGALIPPSGLKDRNRLPIREASVDKEKGKTTKKEARDVIDLMRAVNKYIFLVCVCGLKIKLPPDFQDSTIKCPRCGRIHEIPTAELIAVTAGLGAIAPEKAEKDQKLAQQEQQQEYIRKGKGWETFRCTCGTLLQISPALLASHVTCSTCGRKIRIKDK